MLAIAPPVCAPLGPLDAGRQSFGVTPSRSRHLNPDPDTYWHAKQLAGLEQRLVEAVEGVGAAVRGDGQM